MGVIIAFQIYLVHMLMSNCLPVPTPVFAELEEAGLMASEECKGLNGPSDVVAAQRYKSPEVVDKTAEVLRRHGFEKESNILAGELSRPSSACLVVVAFLGHPSLFKHKDTTSVFRAQLHSQQESAHPLWCLPQMPYALCMWVRHVCFVELNICNDMTNYCPCFCTERK